MSTLKTINIIHPSGSTNNMVSDTGGNLTVGNNLTITNNLTVTGGIIPSSSYRRNHIINGNMRIAQRGTSFTSVANGSLVNHYTLDRWFGYRTSYANNLSVSQQAGFGGAQYCLRHQRAASDTNTGGMLIGQIIESANMADLQGQTVTVSFWARTGANYSGGSLTVGLATGTTADQGAATFISGWAGGTYPINTTQAITSTATRYTFTGTVPSNALEMIFHIVWTPSGTAGAADYIEITNVQVEPGLVATPYEYQKVNEQLAECQRYYQNVGSNFTGVTEGTTAYAISVTHYLPIRTSSPAYAVRTGYYFNARYAGGDINILTPTVTNVTGDAYGVWLHVTTTGVVTNYPVAARHQNSGINDFLSVSAEL